jgi:acyl CoA:acetate/3-ketoacid CoA transferase alpha subunit
MQEAVGRFVPDGASVCMGTALEGFIPSAAGHELTRQRRRDLTLVGPISDILFDQPVGAGCVARIQAAWGRAFSRRRVPRPAKPCGSRRRASLNLSTTEPEPMKITAP